MTYREVLDRIYALGRFGIRPGLERVVLLLERLGNPQLKYPVIHVAGTNGKGSTSAFLASILQNAGLRAGLFTSPHLSSFTERIRVDRTAIPEEAVVSMAEEIFAAAPPGTTFFEIATAMGYLWFERAGVDMAVMEAGMGGRFDATNAAPGVLSVITTLALDHCEYLGDTIELIAAEKAGIITPGNPAVLSLQPEGGEEVIARAAAAAGSRLYRLGVDFRGSWDGSELVYSGLGSAFRAVPGIRGSYQAANAATAAAAAEVLSGARFPIPPEAIRQGVERATWPGRMELVPGRPPVLLDGAHNPSGARALAAELRGMNCRRIILVTGMMGSKDLEGILRPLLEVCPTVVAVSPAVQGAVPAAEVTLFARAAGAEAIEASSVGAGLSIGRDMADERDLVVVAGSLYVVGEARSAMFAVQFEGIRG